MLQPTSSPSPPHLKLVTTVRQERMCLHWIARKFPVVGTRGTIKRSLARSLNDEGSTEIREGPAMRLANYGQLPKLLFFVQGRVTMVSGWRCCRS